VTSTAALTSSGNTLTPIVARQDTPTLGLTEAIKRVRWQQPNRTSPPCPMRVLCRIRCSRPPTPPRGARTPGSPPGAGPGVVGAV